MTAIATCSMLFVCVSCSSKPATVSVVSEESKPAVVDRDSTGGDKVLRHAVFFAFKESSTSEDVQQVVDAFRKLPDNIDAITDFAWGINNSPEGLDDGFTHCFLLSFRDEQGREVYIPHPEHKAFGDVLRPHMKDVFVVDYWGQKESGPARQLKHAVFFKFKDEASEDQVAEVVRGFEDLPGKIDTIKGFEWGTNNSPENKNDGFTHCFLVTFDSEEGRATYLPHAEHQAFVELLTPVLDKVRVLDFWADR